MDKKKILLVGTGDMGYEYAKVLKSLQVNFITVGRGENSAKKFKEKTGILPFTGGAAKLLKDSNYSNYCAIVAVGGGELTNVILLLIKNGIKSILVEKPGGLNEKEIQMIADKARESSVKVFIAYNRRFYSSVNKAKEIIRKDGGILSFHFEFNEPGEKIPHLVLSKKVREQWLLHNSTHVIDLAFFLGGSPKTLSVNTSGLLSWGNIKAIYTGSGLTKEDIPFTYHANWLAPGRWNLEFMTKDYRLIFKPMEKLHVQRHNSFEILEIELDNKLDTGFKPGLFKEVESFLTTYNSLCTIDKQVENLKWYSKISK